MDFSVTLFFIGLLAVLQVPATFFVGIRRVKTKILIADGGDQTLLRRIRAHANFTALLLGRVVHYFTIALTDGSSLLRAVGMVLTFAAMLTFGGYALAQNWPL